MAAGSPRKAAHKSRHRKPKPAHSAAAQWLRLGAVGLGLGAAVTVGQGTATAAPDDSSQTGTHTSTDHGSLGADGNRAGFGPSGRRTKSDTAIGTPSAARPNRNGAAPRGSASTPVTNLRPAAAVVTPARIATLLAPSLPAPTALLNAAHSPDPTPNSGATLDTGSGSQAAVRISAKAAPITVEGALGGALNSIGVKYLPPGLPLPASPVEALFAAVSGAVREVELAFNRHTVRSVAATAFDTGEPETLTAGAAQLASAAAVANSPTEVEREQSQAELNMSVGWVPVLGTALNAMNLVSDFLDFTIAALSGNTANIGDELGDMTVDVIGMIPVVGGPLAATIHNAIVGSSTPADHAPSPVGDNFSTDEDTPLAGNVLSNDTDVDADPLTAALSKQATHGAVVLNGDGSFSYTPNADYNGADSFTYTVSDGIKSKAAKVTLTINSVNDAPAAVDDTATLSEDTPTAIAVLGNDTDIDRDPLSVLNATTPGHGSVDLGQNNTITYTPAADYNGPDSFTYTVTDGHGGNTTATVALTITPVNDPPVAGADNFTTKEDTPLTDNVLTNDTDVDADPLTAIISTQPTHGGLSFNSDGSFTYTPTADYNGADGFTYTVSDGGQNTTGAVTITVNPVNDPPVAGDDSATLDEDTSTVISVLGNDSDTENDPLSVVGAAAPGHGSVSLGEDGTITYTPVANYNGADSFVYTVTDGNGGDTTATVSLTINPVNDPPVAVTDNYSVDENKQLTGNVKANDTDADGDALTVGVVTGPAHGSLALNPDGSFTYKPASDYFGGDGFTYTVTDTSGTSATGSTKITVNYVAPTPPPSGPTVKQKIDAFVSEWRGRHVGDGQCVALIVQYVSEKYGISTLGKGNASDYKSGDPSGAGRGADDVLASAGFTWHAGATDFQDGDIVVWSGGLHLNGCDGDGCGHIGIYHSGQIFDQNDGWHDPHAREGRADLSVANYSTTFSKLNSGDPSLVYKGYWRPPGGSTQYANGTVMARTQRMTAANLSSQQDGWYEVGANLSLVCYARGQSVKGYYSYAISGGFDNLWYKTTDGHFAADVDLNTGSNNPVTGAC